MQVLIIASGSMPHLTEMVKKVSTMYPQAQITLVGKKELQTFDRDGYPVREIRIFDGRPGLKNKLKFVFELRKKKFDLAAFFLAGEPEYNSYKALGLAVKAAETIVFYEEMNYFTFKWVTIIKESYKRGYLTNLFYKFCRKAWGLFYFLFYPIGLMLLFFSVGLIYFKKWYFVKVRRSG